MLPAAVGGLAAAPTPRHGSGSSGNAPSASLPASASPPPQIAEALAQPQKLHSSRLANAAASSVASRDWAASSSFSASAAARIALLLPRPKATDNSRTDLRSEAKAGRNSIRSGGLVTGRWMERLLMPSVATVAQWWCCVESLHERCGPKMASRQAMTHSHVLAAAACSPCAYSGAHCRRPMSWARRWCGWGGLRRLTRLNQSGGNLAEASMASWLQPGDLLGGLASSRSILSAHAAKACPLHSLHSVSLGSPMQHRSR